MKIHYDWNYWGPVWHWTRNLIVTKIVRNWAPWRVSCCGTYVSRAVLYRALPVVLFLSSCWWLLEGRCLLPTPWRIVTDDQREIFTKLDEFRRKIASPTGCFYIHCTIDSTRVDAHAYSIFSLSMRRNGFAAIL